MINVREQESGERWMCAIASSRESCAMQVEAREQGHSNHASRCGRVEADLPVPPVVSCCFEIRELRLNWRHADTFGNRARQHVQHPIRMHRCSLMMKQVRG